MTVYGIRNCNTVKAVLQWLQRHNIAFQFYDYKTKGITTEKLRYWSSQVGWEALLNKRGTTWRQLDAATQNSIVSEEAAIALMHSKTSIIKRPLIEIDDKVILLGFDEDNYRRIFNR